MSDLGYSIQLSNLSFSYKPEVPLLEESNLIIDTGEILGLFGNSGIGKSTLLKLILGLISPTSGSVIFDGQDQSQMPLDISYVTQNYANSLFPWMNIASNVGLPLSKWKMSKHDKAERIEWILEAVGLASEGKKYPWELSGGMQQRVAIARALITKPRLLLLDEPFTSLDVKTKSQLQDLILDFAESRKITTILVSHELDDLIYFCDRLIRIENNGLKKSEEYRISLSRPRNQIITRNLEEFGVIRSQILQDLGFEKYLRTKNDRGNDV